MLEGQSDDPAANVDAQQRAWRTQDALKRLLLRQSQVQPLLLIFENLHWVDGETQLFLDTLVESVPAAAILVLVTYRPEYQHKWASKGHYTQLLIDALPPESAGALVRAVMAEQPGVDEFARLLVERTGGNPLFLEESIKTLVETKVLVGEQRAYRLVKPLNAIEVPATVQAVLAARIDRHAPEEKRLLQSAAVIGKQAPLSLLQAVAESSEQVLRRSIARLQAGEFLYETSLFPEPQYTFKHNLTYEVAYASLLHERRRALHARIVEVVEALPEESRAERAEFLAYHAFQGHLWQKAVRYLRQAGAKALTRAANREAVAHFQKALEALRAASRGPRNARAGDRSALRPRGSQPAARAAAADRLAAAGGREPGREARRRAAAGARVQPPGELLLPDRRAEQSHPVRRALPGDRSRAGRFRPAGAGPPLHGAQLSRPGSVPPGGNRPAREPGRAGRHQRLLVGARQALRRLLLRLGGLGDGRCRRLRDGSGVRRQGAARPPRTAAMPTPRRSPPRSPDWSGCAAASPVVPCRRCSAACKAARKPIYRCGSR